MGGILRSNFGEGNCESKIAARQWRVNFCREASRCLARPSGQLSSPPSPSLFPPPFGPFCDALGECGLGECVGEGPTVQGEEGEVAASGTWGQNHICGFV